VAGIAREVDIDRVEARAFRAAEIAEKLRELKDTDGWQVLLETFERQRQTYYDNLARDLMKGKEIDQRKLDYNRGFFDSVEQMLAAPENAEKILAGNVARLKRLRAEREESEE